MKVSMYFYFFIKKNENTMQTKFFVNFIASIKVIFNIQIPNFQRIIGIQQTGKFLMLKESLQQNLLQKYKPHDANRLHFKSSQVFLDKSLSIEMQEPHMNFLLQLQGECKITAIRFIRFHYIKAFFMLIPVIFSIFGIWFLKNSIKFRVMVMYVIQEEPSNASHVWITGNSGEHEQIQPMEKSTFEFKKLKYEVIGYRAYPYAFKYWSQYKAYFNSEHLKNGLDTANIPDLQQEYGSNSHTVDIPSYSWYMFDIMTKPFFLIQYIICTMFILQKIGVFAYLLLGSTIITTSINYVLLYVSYLKIKEIAESKVNVTLIRDGKEVVIQSDKLYPGDVILVQKHLKMPCDCILLSGEAYVNEASLTGESVPVGKYKIQDPAQLSQSNRWLYQGSNILDCRHDPKALVINTGYRSRRGAIIRKISNKVPVEPQMFKTAIFFFFQTLVVGIIVYWVTLPILLKADITPEFRVYRFFDFIGFSFPPAFPIYFNLAYSFALYRLRKKGVYGTEPHKTIDAGFLKILCFDKTGTLTQNQLQIEKIYAFRPKQTDSLDANELINNLKDPLIERIYQIFASCHSVKHIDGSYLGDEVDLKMFQATGARLQVPKNGEIRFRIEGKKKIDVLKINEFESRNQHMSVLVFDQQTKIYSLFVKGAPEKIHNSTVFKYTYFDDLLKKVSLNGFRSIGLAYRQLSQKEAKQIMSSQIPRDLLNQGNKQELTMVGMVTFQNKLKEDTKETIRLMEEYKIQTNVITGDNVFIAIQTANRAGILKKKQFDNKIIVLEGKNQNTIIKEDELIGQRKFVGKLLNFADRQRGRQSELVLQKETEIILTQNDTYLNSLYPIAIDNDFLRMQPAPRLSSRIKIYARITPENKALIVKRLKQEINKNYDQKDKFYKLTVSRPKIGMVGDGANDLMALKQADVGFGISETDASYGSCFSISRLLNIEETIRESKGTASIIVECLRYFGSISFLKITCSILMMTETTYFSASQLIYFNFASTLIIPIAITLGSPSQYGTSLKPVINMLSMKNHLVYWGNIVIPSLSIIAGYFYFTKRNDFIPNPLQTLTLQGYHTLCQTNTVVFLLVQVPFALNGFFMYNNGHRFKEAFYKNYILALIVMVNFVADIFYFFNTESLEGFLGLVPIPSDAVGVLVAIALGFCINSYIFNWWVETRKYQEKAFNQEHTNQSNCLQSNRQDKIKNQNYKMNYTETFQVLLNNIKSRN